MYPGKKQIDAKLISLVGMVRLYIMDKTKPFNVRNALRCLFTDLVLNISNKDDEQAVNCHFETFIRELANDRIHRI